MTSSSRRRSMKTERPMTRSLLRIKMMTKAMAEKAAQEKPRRSKYLKQIRKADGSIKEIMKKYLRTA